MSDLISRQAAIDAIRKEYGGIRNANMDGDFLADEIEFILSKMPHAQPKIIRCRDCKYGSPNGRYGCRVYHYQKYETHDMEPDDFCSRAERREDG